MPSGVYKRTKEMNKNMSMVMTGKIRSLSAIENNSKAQIKAQNKPEVKEKKSKSSKEWYKTHKSPMQGKHHKEESKSKESDTQIKRLQNESHHYKNKNVFFRKDLGHICRSKFEANYCRVLKRLGIEYKYESKAFKLSNGKNYLPDIYKPKVDAYFELKGYMYEDAKEKIELFRKEYPMVQLVIVMQSSKHWKEMEMTFKYGIKEWEK